MSLLAPLYIAGLLAISLPILFHLIRRTPQGRQAFSSLMFLAPSPPRITRRSRLSNILLLLLRAAALALLAFAFARPFFHQSASADVSQAKGRRIAVLVDTSASMQRGDLWTQATNQFNAVVDAAAPEDELGLFFFDKTVRPAMTFSEWNETELSRRAPTLKARFADAKPTSAGTNLGTALANVADTLAESQNTQQHDDDAIPRQLVLISDLQQGSHADALQGHQWPANVTLEVKPVTLKARNNASLQFIKDAVESQETPEQKVRIRVTNQPDSESEQLTLSWANERSMARDSEPQRVYVPAGRSQVVKLDWPSPESGIDRLVLAGDDADFDNTLFAVPPRQDLVRVVYLGDDSTDDPSGLRFYLDRVVSPTPLRKVDVVAHPSADTLAATDLANTRLVVVASALTPDRVNLLRDYINRGGDVLWVLKDVGVGEGLQALLPADGIEIAEATGGRNYALIARVVLDHPLFAPFADSRFSDFTKIHFWKHRRVKLNGGSDAIHVLSSFDDGDPFLLEQTIGKGRLLIATSGWNPVDSQLALSTKFVPLIDGLLRRRDGAVLEAQYAVGDSIALPPNNDQQPRSMIRPDGTRIEIPATATTFDAADRPGVYYLNVGETRTPLAVNLPADESRTAPLAVEELEQWGARMGSKPISEKELAEHRQLQTLELENRQKVWRWLIVAVLAILVVETALAGRLARRTLEPQVTT
jgi:hypothetical protein